MTTTAWGPLAPLIGTWESDDDGIDISFHSDQGKLGETRYRERTTYDAVGPVQLGTRTLYGLDYRTQAWRVGEDQPFHTEIGYWMWDHEQQLVVRCFLVPHATSLIAGGHVTPDASTLTLSSSLGSPTYGILSSQFFTAVAQTTRFDVTVTLRGDSYSYEQTTQVEYQEQPTVILHTDRNTLRRVHSTTA